VGLFSRIKGAVSSKASAALDRAIDPARELDLTIANLEEGRRRALEELLSYKTGAKTTEQELARHVDRARQLGERAMIAVRAGDDPLARECLREQKAAEAEIAKVTRDRDELARHAIELNRSRKQLETRLKILKLKKGTLATQLASARGGKDPLHDDELFDKLAVAEERIDADADLAEVDASLAGESAADAELDRRLAAAAAAAELAPVGDADPQQQLKDQMKAEADARPASLPPKPTH
jgi:phage shock protein A